MASWRIHRLIGASSTKLMTDCIGRPDDEVKASWRSHFEQLVPEVRAFPGARDLIDAVKARGGRAVWSTSSPEDLIGHHLQALGLSVDDLSGVTADTDVDEALLAQLDRSVLGDLLRR